MQFSVYGEWSSGDPVPDVALSSFDRNFRPADESACVWVDERRPSVLQVSIDLETDTPDGAIAECRAAIADAAAGAGLSGKVVTVTAMIDNARWVWDWTSDTRPDDPSD